MKKILSVTIALCLIFSSFSCAFAADWTSSQISSVVNDVNIISASIDDIFTAFAGQTGIMYNTISEMMSWLTPVGSFNSSDSLTGFTLYEMIDYICYLLGYSGTAVATVYDLLTSTSSNIANINGNIISWMGTNNNHLNNLEKSLYNGRYAWNDSLTNWTYTYALQNASMDLWGGSTAGVTVDAKYWIPTVRKGNLPSTTTNLRWVNGTPLGNIAAILQKMASNQAYGYAYNFDDELEGFNDTLTTWDSQGNTLSQVTFTPKSAINGLYRYLAFAQRDIARLTYVLASDEEIETREKAKATQTAVMDDFVDPDGDGAASVNDFGSISDASSGVQSNFNTGVSAGGVWNVFERNYEWFSQETANNLAYQPNRSNKLLKASDPEYDTPYLDSYYEELHEIIGF